MVREISIKNLCENMCWGKSTIYSFVGSLRFLHSAQRGWFGQDSLVIDWVLGLVGCLCLQYAIRKFAVMHYLRWFRLFKMVQSVLLSVVLTENITDNPA